MNLTDALAVLSSLPFIHVTRGKSPFFQAINPGDDALAVAEELIQQDARALYPITNTSTGEQKDMVLVVNRKGQPFVTRDAQGVITRDMNRNDRICLLPPAQAVTLEFGSPA